MFIPTLSIFSLDHIFNCAMLLNPIRLTMSVPNVTSLTFLALIMAMNVLVPKVDGRAFFVFGDSLVDSGNNNYLATTARADSPPYGIDYPTGRPTGRFSNGLNIPDFIS